MQETLGKTRKRLRLGFQLLQMLLHLGRGLYQLRSFEPIYGCVGAYGQCPGRSGARGLTVLLRETTGYLTPTRAFQRHPYRAAAIPVPGTGSSEGVSSSSCPRKEDPLL